MRIAICQPLVPKYRVPVFELLGKSSGIKLDVYAGQDSGSLKAVSTSHSYNLHHAEIINLFGMQFQKMQIVAVNPEKYDMVILPWDIHYLSLCPAIIKSKLNKVPIVLWGHGYSKRRGRVRDIVRNFIGRQASGVLLYSNTVAEHLVRQNGFQSEKTFVAQNALDAKSINRAVNYWRANGAKLERFQHKNDISPQNTVIFVSRLEKDNKIDLLILGIEKLKQDKPKSRLVIIGGGSDEGRLKNLVKAKQLDDCVLFPGPIYDEKKLAPWMLSAALFCYPVNIGLSLLHAFAYGLPVVTSDDVKSHNPEIEALIPGVNGLLYHDGDIDDLVAKWADIMDNHRMRAKLSMAAQQRSDRKYTIETMVKGFIDLGRAMVKNG